MRIGRSALRRAGITVAIAATATAVLTAPASAADAVQYVAMGDSYAAGPLIPPVDPNLPCARSKKNYPHVAAERLGADLVDVTCSGATVDDFSTKQFGFEAPQYDALTADTDLVSVTIGGNDVGLVSDVISCINPLPEPIGFSCKARFTKGGTDQISAKIAEVAPTIGRALDEIHARAPQAKVLLVGYGDYIKPGGCYPIAPLFARDADYIQAKIDELNATLADQAASHGASFVDTRGPSVGHDVCQPIGTKWFESILPTSPAAPLHPNADGMAAFGALVAGAAD